MQRVREAAAKAQQAQQDVDEPKPKRVRMTAVDRERAKAPGAHCNRVVMAATSVVLVGPIRWRIAVDKVLAGVSKIALAVDVEGDPREVDIYSIPQGDVALIAVDGNSRTTRSSSQCGCRPKTGAPVSPWYSQG